MNCPQTVIVLLLGYVVLLAPIALRAALYCLSDDELDPEARRVLGDHFDGLDQ